MRFLYHCKPPFLYIILCSEIYLNKILIIYSMHALQTPAYSLTNSKINQYESLPYNDFIDEIKSTKGFKILRDLNNEQLMNIQQILTPHLNESHSSKQQTQAKGNADTTHTKCENINTNVDIALQAKESASAQHPISNHETIETLNSKKTSSESTSSNILTAKALISKINKRLIGFNISDKDCIYCHNTSFRKAIIKCLNIKHYTSKDSYNLKVINDIIYNEPTHVVSIFKDYLIYDDVSEFLKRFYKSSESGQRLPKIFDFYNKYSKVFPNYINLSESKFMFKNIEKKQKLIDEQQQQSDKKNQAKGSDSDDENAIFTSTFLKKLNKQGSTMEQSISQADSLLHSYIKNSNKIMNEDPKELKLQELLEIYLLKDSISFAKPKTSSPPSPLKPTNSLKPSSLLLHQRNRSNNSKSSSSKAISIFSQKSTGGKQVAQPKNKNEPCKPVLQIPATVKNLLKLTDKKITINPKSDNPLNNDKLLANKVPKVPYTERPLVHSKNAYNEEPGPVRQRERETVKYYSPVCKSSAKQIDFININEFQGGQASHRKEPNKFEQSSRPPVNHLSEPQTNTNKNDKQNQRCDSEFQKMIANLKLRISNTNDYKSVRLPISRKHEDARDLILQSRNSQTPYQAVTHKAQHSNIEIASSPKDCMRNQNSDMLIKSKRLVTESDNSSNNNKYSNKPVLAIKTPSQAKVSRHEIVSSMRKSNIVQPQSMRYERGKTLRFSNSVSAFEKQKGRFEQMQFNSSHKDKHEHKLTQKRSASKGFYDNPISLSNRRK